MSLLLLLIVIIIVLVIAQIIISNLTMSPQARNLTWVAVGLILLFILLSQWPGGIALTIAPDARSGTLVGF